MPIYWKAVDGTAGGVIPGADEGIHDYNIGDDPGEPGEPGLPADINEPIDLLGSEKPANPYRVEITRYTGGAEYM